VIKWYMVATWATTRGTINDGIDRA